jgi:hypothetical protein
MNNFLIFVIFINIFCNIDQLENNLQEVSIDEFRRKSLSPFLNNQIKKDLSSIKKFSKDDLYQSYLNYSENAYIKIHGGKISYEMNFHGHPALTYRLNVLINVLNKIKNNYRLPNTEFVINLGDGFTNNTNFSAPVFVFCKSSNFENNLILFPDVECLESENLINKVKLANQTVNWRHKRNKVIWRGKFTGGYDNQFLNPRYIATNLSKNIPHLLDASLIELELFPSIGHKDYEFCQKLLTQRYSVPKLDINSQFLYKYQLLIDGNTCSWSGALWRWFSQSCTLKVDSDNIQWYYGGLIPNVHYIPVKKDLSDLEDKIISLMNDDNLAKKIANNAFDFANKNLKISDMHYYIHRLLVEYAKITNF